MSFEAVFELLAVLFQIIRQAKPLDGQQEHPVYGLLQRFVTAIILVQFAHTLFTVPQVKGLFFIYLDEGAFPGAKGGTLVDIAEERVSGPVIESIGDDQFYPAIQGNIKGIGVLKVARLALKDQGFCVYTQVPQQTIRNMRVSQLILNNRDR